MATFLDYFALIADLKPGLEAEVAFKAYPGKIFRATLSHVLPTTAEGQFTTSGQLRTVTPGVAAGRIPVMFNYGPDVEELALPGDLRPPSRSIPSTSMCLR